MIQLKPFQSTALNSTISVLADFFQLSPTQILVEFHISGLLQNISWPAAPQTSEVRQDELWKNTCLEAFFSSGSSPQDPYLEINCSPNGNWNAYSFSSYRQGMSPAADITVRLKERHSTESEAVFRIEISAQKALPANNVGLTAVIEFNSNEKSYWSLKHPGPQADFHNKSGWK